MDKLHKVQQRLMTDGLTYYAGILTINLLKAFLLSRTWAFEVR